MNEEKSPTLNDTLLNSDVLQDTSKKADDDDADASLYKKWVIDEDSAAHKVKMGLIYGTPLIAVVIVLTYLHHVAGYPGLRWLTTDDLREIRSIAISVLSGVSSSLAVGYFFRQK